MIAPQNSAAVTDVTFHSTYRKGYRRVADVVSEACFTVMTGDRHDERAAMNFSMIIFFILITCLLDIVLILRGEILSWSLMGVKGLRVT